MPTLIIGICRVSGALAQPAEDAAETVGEAPTWQLSYTSTGCAAEDRVRDLVRARLGYDPFRPQAAGETESPAEALRVEVGPTQGGFLAQIWQSNDSGSPSRALRSGTCDDLLEALATALALAIDPFGRPASHEEEEGQQPETEDATEGLVVPPSPASTPARARSTPVSTPTVSGIDLGFRGHLMGGVSFGIVPSPSVAMEVALGLSIENVFSLALTGLGEVMPAGIDVGPSNATLAMNAYGGGLLACLHLGVLSGCMHGTVGAMRGDVTTPEQARTDLTILGALMARLGLALPLDASIPLLFTAAVDLFVPVVRTRVHVNGVTEWSAEPIGARILVGLGVALGDG